MTGTPGSRLLIRRSLGGLLLASFVMMAAAAWYVVRLFMIGGIGGGPLFGIGGIAVVLTGAAATVARENGWRRLAICLFVLGAAGIGVTIWGMYKFYDWSPLGT